MSTVLITGANRGLGFEFCHQYAAAGWNVLACCRRPQAAKNLEALAVRQPGISLHALDVADHRQIERLAGELGGRAIDVLLNNAGVYGDSKPNAFGSIDYDRWLEVFRINTLAPVKLAETLLPHIMRSQRKLIVAITSLMGSMTDNSSGGAILYRSSKAALNAAMKSLAIDLRGRGVGVLILHPGWVKTDMGGTNAPTSPEESIAGMRRVIDQFTLEASGRFFNFKGQEQPW